MDSAKALSRNQELSSALPGSSLAVDRIVPYV